MTYQHVLITGGAGFVGSNLAVWYKSRFPDARVIAADNLRRRGSEANLPRLRAHGVEFLHCDIRNPEDLRLEGRPFDLLIECSAEPSVLAGYGEAPDYVINTNLVGTINCLEFARRTRADFGLGNGLTNALATAYGNDRPDLARRYVTTSLAMLTGVTLLIGGACALAWP